MTDQDKQDRWPNYLPLPRDDILAIGVLALNYGQLENMFRSLLAAVAQWNDYQTAAVFHRLPNNHRLDAISEMLAKTSIPAETKEAVEHFLAGFKLCADTRNLIMHSASAGMHKGGGLVLERHSKAGNELVCYLTLADLRRIADDAHAFMTWGGWVVTDVTNYATHLQSGHPENYNPLPPSTLREKPPLPTGLNWKTPARPRARGIPPAALHLISPYRIHDGEQE